MGLFESKKRVCAEALSNLSYCNPFLPERIDFERVILGEDFTDSGAAWHKPAGEVQDRPNIGLLTSRSKELADWARTRIENGATLSEKDSSLYEDVVLYYLYNKYESIFHDYIMTAIANESAGTSPMPFFTDFRHDMADYFSVRPRDFPVLNETDHVFACFYQIRRAFQHIYENIIGGSMASAELRAEVWQSIFTCDMRRWRRGLYDRMGDITTLITGPSGTGKELVARAIGLSSYIPVDSSTQQPSASFTSEFYPVNLSSLSPTLIESELFGHTKGSFTGAIADRPGLFEQCSPYGTVFLDEIAELDSSIQIKLLRVLQTRGFQRIGDTTERRFHGKTVAATNRDPVVEMRAGRFREDLYYRLCSDIIVTPSLRDQVKGAREQLRNLLLFICMRVTGEDEAETMAIEVEQWITENMEPDYAWPGNVRELEQCVRNYVVRKSYRPPAAATAKPVDEILEDIRKGSLTAKELLRRYCTLVYAETGSYQKTARRLDIDRRTVRARIDEDLLERLNG